MLHPRKTNTIRITFSVFSNRSILVRMNSRENKDQNDKVHAVLIERNVPMICGSVHDKHCASIFIEFFVTVHDLDRSRREVAAKHAKRWISRVFENREDCVANAAAQLENSSAICCWGVISAAGRGHFARTSIVGSQFREFRKQPVAIFEKPYPPNYN